MGVSVKKEITTKGVEDVIEDSTIIADDGEYTLATIGQLIPRNHTQENQIRVPRGMVNNMLKGYKHTLKQPLQTSIWDDLEESVKGKIRDLKVDKQELYIGIDLDGDGWEIVEVLQKILYLHSNTTDQRKENYYKGEADPSNAVTIWDGKKVPMAYIKTSLAELTKIRTGKAKPAGSDIATTERILNKYSLKRFLGRYREYYTETKPNGKTKNSYREKMEYFFLYESTITKDKGLRTSVVEIWLTPAFFKQITTNYDLKPIDYLERVRNTYNEVSGSKRNQMPNYLLVFISQLMEAQHYDDRTYHCSLLGTTQNYGIYDRLNYSWVKARHWGKLKEQLEQFVEVAKRIGLLERYWIAKSDITGDDIAYFQVVGLGEWV